MTESAKTSDELPARKDCLSWVPLSTGGDVFLGLQEAQTQLRNAYECIQRVELLIGGFKSGIKQP